MHSWFRLHLGCDCASRYRAASFAGYHDRSLLLTSTQQSAPASTCQFTSQLSSHFLSLAQEHNDPLLEPPQPDARAAAPSTHKQSQAPEDASAAPHRLTPPAHQLRSIATVASSVSTSLPDAKQLDKSKPALANGLATHQGSPAGTSKRSLSNHSPLHSSGLSSDALHSAGKALVSEEPLHDSPSKEERTSRANAEAEEEESESSFSQSSRLSWQSPSREFEPVVVSILPLAR